ncbi:bacterio-opsin activator domain-containing protein [Haloferax namakaokahaiae]|uniref:Bacterio-opsin activator domain-containing protein n=1 Tax=Haloferax namakaokahaiae TaxID=1748331 RepID=A0ABD5ZI45_9EURY
MGSLYRIPIRVVALADAPFRDRVERVLEPLSPDFVETITDVEAATDPPDCVVVASDDRTQIETALTELADSPVVVVHPLDGDLSVAAAFDTGAADVVPITETNVFERLPDRIRSVVAWRREKEPASERITEDLKERAMDAAPVGISLADASLPDQPLVYINDFFESMTGYGPREALGRNCRYLQGPETDPAAVSKLREAVNAELPASVELLNYRRDGESFWNRIDLAPIRDETGEVTHYVGFQTDITERVRAEEAAERYAAEVETERARLQRLVEHIEGLLEDVTSALVRAESRVELERSVCERVAGTPEFACAWIGGLDLAPDTIAPSVWGGTATDSLSNLRIDRTDADPVAEAVRTQSIRAAYDADGAIHPQADVPYSGVIAVPLVHRETLYGVLCVYAEDGPIDSDVHVVFGSLGRAVGAAIDAFESRRTLLSNAVVELEIDLLDSAQPLVRFASLAECRLEYEGLTSHDDGTVSLFVSTTPPASLERPNDAIAGVRSATDLVQRDGAGLSELRFAPDSLVERIADSGGRLVDLAADADGCRVTVVVPDRAVGRALLGDLRAAEGGIELRAVRERATPPQTRREFVSQLGDELTPRQHAALQVAYLGGFFEWPHGITGDELAATMDISRATYHQHLRAAERKLVSHFFEASPS